MGTVGIGEIAVDAGAATDALPDAMDVTGTVGAVGAGNGIPVVVVGGGKGRLVWEAPSTWLVAAAEGCASGGSGVVVVCAPAKDVNDR